MGIFHSCCSFSSVYLAHVLGSQLIVNLPRDTRSENTYHFLVQTSTCVGSTYSESFKRLEDPQARDGDNRHSDRRTFWKLMESDKQ